MPKSIFYSATLTRFRFFTLVLIFTCLTLVSCQTVLEGSSQSRQNEILCGDFDVRRPSALARIKSCTVIEGNLLIVMTQLPTNASIPNLREITGFLVIYDLTGLDGLATLFPNLTVIRGRSLISNFALVIRSTSLKTIDMPSLRMIQRGGVRVESNTNLCYVRTVNWSYILGNQTAAAAPIRLLTNRLICPDTCNAKCVASTQDSRKFITTSLQDKDGKISHCWSATNCQSICSPTCTIRGLACRVDDTQSCCHEECLAGCYGAGPGACVACKGALHRGVCVSHCPPNTYLFYGRRCVTASECFSLSSIYRIPQLVGSVGSQGSSGFGAGGSNASSTPLRQFALHQGRCVPDCPSGHQRDASSGECVPCGENCPRIQCSHMLISSLKSLSKLKDCYSVSDLYISIHEGDPALIQQQFDEAFSSLREVESIKIVRATALTSLAFLRHVKRINVTPNPTPNATVLEIRGNDNLLELWPPPADNASSGGLQLVSEGLVHIVLNRYLCPKKITDLVKTGALVLPGGRNFRTEERELAEATNGKLGFCETTRISLELKDVFSTSAVIQWSRFFDNRQATTGTSTLVLVFFQATTKNLTVYSNRLSCGDDAWKMIPSMCNASTPEGVGGENVAFCSKTLTSLQPATRYAVYVESKTLFSQRGAISNIVYFTTNPSNPSHPRLERLTALNDSRIAVKWSPPQFTNGPLAAYLLWFRAIHIDPEPYLHRDFCFLTPDWLSSAMTTSYRIETSRLTGSYWSYALLSGPQQCSARFYESLWMVDVYDESLPVVFVNRLSRTLRDDEVGLLVVNAHKDQSDLLTSTNFDVVSQIGNKYFTITLPHLRSFSQYIVELQACQKPRDGSDFPWMSDLRRLDTTVGIKIDEKWRTYLSRYCSHRVFKTQRTLAAAGADNVNYESIRSEQDAAGTVRVLWAEPLHPNGVIIYYVLRYRRAEQSSVLKIQSSRPQPTGLNETETESSSSSVVWSTLCVTRASWQSAGLLGGLSRAGVLSTINNAHQSTVVGGSAGALLAESEKLKRLSRSLGQEGNLSAAAAAAASTATLSVSQDHNLSMGGAELLNLLPGFYELQIMAVSLAGNSSWTPPVLFEVTTSPIDTITTVTAVCGLVLFALVILIVACVIYRIRKKRLMDSEWNSPNPEYWHVYEVDDWEMQLEDIDTMNFRHPLGRGNFGMVYQGCVRNLRTPANYFYKDPHNIPAAIKTLSSTSTVFDRRDFITEACYMKQFQSFHIVRLFGIVSKCTPSSNTAAARTFRGVGVAGGSGSGSGGAAAAAAAAAAATTNTSGGGGNAAAASGQQQQSKVAFSLRRLLTGEGSFWRRKNQPSRQAVPVLIKKKPLSLSAEAAAGTTTTTTTMTTTGNAGSQNHAARVSPNGGQNGFDKGTNKASDRSSSVKRDWLRGGRFGRFFKRYQKESKPTPTNVTNAQDESAVATVQHCSSSDSLRPFSHYGLFVVMELMVRGDLASYLRKLGDNGIGFVNPAQAYLWAVQIADGMAYLERKKYVHRDLAARNCLVDDKGVVKVGDFGLCRDIYERNYYQKVGAGTLPVRWMAPESLQSAYFTSRSDVWSFGVVLWEIATMASLPYQGMSHSEVTSYVLDGKTLFSQGAPINCPPLLQSVMLYCWSFRPNQRPSFHNLLFLLAPRFADADFRQASYFYMGDTFSKHPPPYQELQNATAGVDNPVASFANADFADLPGLIKAVLGPPSTGCADGSGGSNSLSEVSPQPPSLTNGNGTGTAETMSASTANFYSPSPHLTKAEFCQQTERDDEEVEDAGEEKPLRD